MSSDAPAGVPTGPGRLAVTVLPALALFPVAGPPAPINRIRALAATPTDLIIDSTEVDVSPLAASWELVLTVPAWGGVVGVYLSLINVADNGTETIEFSRRSDPFTLIPGAEVSVEIPLVRGTPCGVVPDWTIQTDVALLRAKGVTVIDPGGNRVPPCG